MVPRGPRPATREPAVPAPPQSRPNAGAASAARIRPAFAPALLAVLAVVLTAGLLFGYDQAAIGTAMPAALAGALLAGELAERVGRRRAILAAGALFAAGAALQGLEPPPVFPDGSHLVIGIGAGMAGLAAPLYAAELAPAALRGRFVCAYQLAVTAAMVAAVPIERALAGSYGPRATLGGAAALGALLLLAALVAPESPRWLMMAGRRPASVSVLERLAPALADGATRTSWAAVFAQECRGPLCLGIGLAIFRQATGIAALIDGAYQIFPASGFVTTAAPFWTVGGAGLLGAGAAVFSIDRLGRRALLLTGLIGMAAGLIVVGVAVPVVFSAPPEAADMALIAILAGLASFVACFAFSLGPVVMTLISEIFPVRARGRAMALAMAANWAAAFVVERNARSIAGALGDSATFWLFAMFCGVGWVWVYFSVPETKGRSLEQIEAAWREARAA